MQNPVRASINRVFFAFFLQFLFLFFCLIVFFFALFSSILHDGHIHGPPASPPPPTTMLVPTYAEPKGRLWPTLDARQQQYRDREQFSGWHTRVRDADVYLNRKALRVPQFGESGAQPSDGVSARPPLPSREFVIV